MNLIQEKKFSFEEFLQENYKSLKIQTQIFDDYFIDIGIPEDYRRFMDDIFTPSK